MKILSKDWQPSEATMKVLKLNELKNEHIQVSIQFLKEQFINTSIDEIDGYESWGALLIVFAIKARNAKRPD